MIVRLVTMHFTEKGVREFLSFFETVKEKIRQQPGCRHLELLKDVIDNKTLMTYSHWDSELDLNNYRHTEFFKATWSETKKHFSDKPKAISLTSLQKLI